MAFVAHGKLSMDGSGFHRTMKRAQSAVKGFGARMKAALGPAGMMGLAAGGAYMLKRLIGDTVDWGTRMRDLGKIFGVDTKFLQEMEYSATQTGMELEAMMKMYRKMAVKADQATNQLTSKLTKEMLVDAFSKLGISMRQLETMKPQEMFLQIARNMKNVSGNTAGIQQAMNDVFGKSGSELINTFNVGIDGMTERFRTLGATVEDDVIQRLGATGDKMEELKQRSKGWAGDFAGGIMGFTDHIDIMSRALGDFMRDRSSVKGLIKTFHPFTAASNYLDMATFYETAKQEKDFEAAKKKSADMAAKKAEADRRMAVEAQREAQESANEMQRRRAEAEAKRQATWGVRGGDKLEKIGGRLGMATTQLNISQQQLALMIKAQKVREAQNATVQKLNSVLQN
tara:strand:+ start:96 stop:1292 length:1197 start_codon:yes stop_codon:yes gene_type:complete